MANIKISEFDNAGALDGTEIAPIVQASANYKVSLNTIVTWILNTAWVWVALQTFGRLIASNFGSVVQSSLAPSGTTETIDFNNGKVVNLSLASASGNVTLTLNNPIAGAEYDIYVTQGATARQLIFPGTVKRYDALTSNTFTMDVSSLYGFEVSYDGTNYVINFGKLS